MKKILLSALACFYMAVAFAQIPTTGLIERFRFNNSMTGVNSNTLTATLSNTYITDNFGIASGARNIVNLSETSGNVTGMPTGNNDRSFAFWAKASSSVGLIRSFFNHGLGNFFFVTLDGGTLKAGTLNNGITETSISAIYPTNMTDWHHIVVTHTATLSILYIDGVQVASGVLPANTSNDAARMGLSPGGASYPGFALNELLIYNRVLTLAEITNIYNFVDCVPNSSTTSLAACDTYTWNGNTYTQGGTYRDTLTNVTGCDSIATLNLIIHDSNGAAPFIGGLSFLQQFPCAANPFTFVVPQPLGGADITQYSYQWSFPSDWTTTGNTTTYVIDGTYGFASGVITVTATNSCGVSSLPYETYVVSPQSGVPQINAIVKNSNCMGNDVMFYVSDTSMPTASWSSSQGWAGGIAYQGFAPYTYFNVTNTSGDVTVTLTNACGSSAPFTQSFSFDTMPATPVITQVGNDLTTTAVADIYCWYEGGLLRGSGGSSADTCIVGPSGMTWTPPYDGVYTLVIESAAGCNSDEAIDFEYFSVSATNYFADSDAFNLFPNPAGNNVIISNLPVGATLRMIDLNGRVLITEIVNNPTLNLDISSLPNAMYFIQIENEGVINTRKIVVTK